MIEATWNGPYSNTVAAGHRAATESALQTLRKELAAMEASAKLGLNGSGDVSATSTE